MIGIIGIVVILVMVFGGYIAAGGKMAIIIHALPFEMIIIGGAAVGAFIISNDGAAVKQTLKDMGKVFKGVRWKGQDFQDLLCLLFELIKIARQNPVELEGHIENPHESAIFGKYPKIQHDHAAVDMICDTFRNATMNYDDPNQVEEVLDKQLDAEKHHALHSSHAMQQIADGLPALGIVAAVLGVIKTMASIDQPPAVLGGLIGGALVGTFLGVFLAYGIMGPFAAKVKTVCEADHQFYVLIREVLVANLHNHAPNICIEVGRQNTPHSVRPSFNAMDEALRNTKGAAA
ncbi:flagellar motor stator protein MotA (plasmid) [Paroceanicella profunda]|uniref:Flagellar motor stator protein MotA n=1 Tax=Paroceanicella profunda TaxID=2579971 RepID=A0A5B8FJD3_9RHOB|nr:flagellar motor stator protein MotA [Paroceanicella profunda]QDL94761.1 flagellar motor stator protein MotA [Paroceanicella profunda]